MDISILAANLSLSLRAEALLIQNANVATSEYSLTLRSVMSFLETSFKKSRIVSSKGILAGISRNFRTIF